MASIKINQPKGIIPRIANKLLPENAAQKAENVDLISGRWEPILSLGSTVDTQAGNTIYKWRRNDSSEWLSTSGIEDFVVGPIIADEYDRVYYTDGGTLKMHAWKSGKVSRNVGLTAPTNIPAVTSTPINTWRFNPNSSANDLRAAALTTNSTSFGTNNDTDAGTLDHYYYTSDGKFHAFFKFQARRYPTITGATWVSYYLNSNVTYRLTVDANAAGSDVSIPLVWGSSAQNESIPLYIGTVQYGTLEIEQIFTTGRSVSWIDGATGVDLISKLPTGTTATCTVSDYLVEFVLDLNYIDKTGSKIVQTAYYVQSYVDDLGEESPVSSISDAVEFVPGQRVSLSLGADPGGNIVKRRIYRSAAGSEEDAFFLLDEISSAATTYIDTKPDAELEDEMPLFENPPTNLTGIARMPNGFLVGFYGKTLYPSEQWLPYSYPTAYRFPVKYDIIGLAVAGNDLIVLTKGNPFIVTGTHPSNLTAEEIPNAQACVSRRSIAVMKDMVLYGSPDGVVGIRHGTGDLITEKYYDKDGWDALTPSSGIGAVQDKKYYLWMTGKNLTFDLDEGLSAITSHDISATAVYTDLEDDTMYVSQSGAIKAWGGTATKKIITWRSKEEDSSRRWVPICARVVADSYNVTLRLYANNSLVSTVTITSGDSIRLPGGLRAEKVWSIEVLNDDAIDAVLVGTSMRSIRI